MSTIAFDALAYVRKLEAAGVPRPQAEAQAAAFVSRTTDGAGNRRMAPSHRARRNASTSSSGTGRLT